MNTNNPQLPPPPPQEPAQSSLSAAWSTRPFRANKKVVGGVCEGIGIRYQIDPILIRIIFILTTLVGIGVGLYVLCWLLMPREGLTVSPAGALINWNKDPRVSRDRDLAIVLIVLSALFGFFPFRFFAGDMPLFSIGAMVALVGVALVAWLLYMKQPQPPAGFPPTTGPRTNPNPQAYGPQTATEQSFYQPSYETSPLMSTPPSNDPGPQDPNLNDPDQQAQMPEQSDTPEFDSAAQDPVTGETSDTSSEPYGEMSEGLPGTESMPTATPYAPITAPVTETNTTAPTSVFLRVLGWFFFVFGVGIALLVLATTMLLGGGAAETFTAVIFAISIVAFFAIFTFAAYARGWAALGAFVLATLTGIAGMVIGIGSIDRDTTIVAQSQEIYVPDTESLADYYDLGNGKAVLDLSDLEPLDEPRRITVDGGVGSFTVMLPHHVPVTVECSVGVGSTFCQDNRYLDDMLSGERLTIDLHARIGEVSTNNSIDGPPLQPGETGEFDEKGNPIMDSDDADAATGGSATPIPTVTVTKTVAPEPASANN